MGDGHVQKSLEILAQKWPDNLILFAANGTLLLVESGTGKVVGRYEEIKCDGGDPDFSYREDSMYIKHLVEINNDNSG